MSDLRVSQVTAVAGVLFKYATSGLGRTDPLAETVDRPEGPPPVELASDLERLGPTFVKLGQLLSTRADLLPPAHLEALQKLQDQVDPFPFEEVAEIIAEELGTRVETAFEWFEEEPVASGSLAQVHRAKIRRGPEVAVKVQRPGIRQRINEDLALLEKLAGVADKSSTASTFRPKELIDRFRRSLAAELDFLREAQNLRVMARTLGDFDALVVPEPFDDYTTGRVLTMTFIPGKSIVSLGPLGRMEVDGERLADQLVHSYLRQVFIEGLVHADPHPGNVLVTEEGRLALIDLGMTVYLEPDVRQVLLELVLSVVGGQATKVTSLVTRLGSPQPGFDPKELQDEVAEIMGDYLHAPPARKRAGELLLKVVRASGACGLEPPIHLTMLGRTLLSLDWVSEVLAPDLDVDEVIERHSMELMEGHTLSSLSPGNVMQTMLATGELLQELPERINRITETLANGRFRLQVDAVDEEGWQEAFRGAANRITYGLVVAALIVGSALLVRVETSFTLFDYPALAVLFFLAGAISGLVLIISIIRDK